MSLKSFAQDMSEVPYIVLEQEDKPEEVDFVRLPNEDLSVEIPEHQIEEIDQPIELEVAIEFDGIPGGILPGAPDSEEPIIEVVEPMIEVEESKKDKKEDSDDARVAKKNDKWDWSSKGAHGFVAWVKERFETVPKHSGYDTAGLERAISYLEKLDSEISKAMRLDVDGELDANKVEEVRSKIEDGIEKLDERLNKIKKSKKGKNKKKADAIDLGLIKEAQKITGVQGTYVTVPLIISAIARICINSVVSAGHDLNKVYSQQVEKYKLSPREKAEVKWFLYDMGYPLRGDRGFWADNEEYDATSSDNYDYSANYPG